MRSVSVVHEGIWSHHYPMHDQFSRRGGGGKSSAILTVTRSAQVVGSTSDEATGVLTWLLRTYPFAHSDCSKVGDEKYVTGKYPAGE